MQTAYWSGNINEKDHAGEVIQRLSGAPHEALMQARRFFKEFRMQILKCAEAPAARRCAVNRPPWRKILVHPLLARTGSLCLLAGSLVFADVRLPSVIGSHMVLQQKKNVTLWGRCEPGERIRIMADWDTTVHTVTGLRDASWSSVLKTPEAGGPYRIIISGGNAIVLEDVMIGEVWVCGGQSNMEWSGAQGLKQSIEEAPRAIHPGIRLFHIPKSASETPQENGEGQWKVCDPEAMKRFSAVGYFFGRKLHQELGVPIGLINASWGGTPAEVWTPAERVEDDPVLREAAGRIPDFMPLWPVVPAVGYNAMIHPIRRFPIAGVIWYQGESNVETASTYAALFRTLIGAWRGAWGSDFPFYYVQIAPFSGYGKKDAGALLREAQTRCLDVPGTGMVVVSDLVDDVANIHPRDKAGVGLRLAGWALSETYGRKGIAYKSPQYLKMNIEKDRIRITFNGAEGGLESRGGEPSEFMIAGDDRRFRPARARIEGSTVVVWSPAVSHPAAVRFGFGNASIPNLFSREGLPVNLFRTDDWPAGSR
jgi:sialate O-acetylesterase